MLQKPAAVTAKTKKFLGKQKKQQGRCLSIPLAIFDDVLQSRIPE
jgi:hypothetical protein